MRSTRRPALTPPAAGTNPAPTPAAPADAAPPAPAAPAQPAAAEPAQAEAREGGHRRRARRGRARAADARDERDAREAPPEVAGGAPAELRVTRFVVSRGVAGREPVGASSSFGSEVDKLYAFVELQNEAKAESEVFVSFQPPGGGRSQRVKLEVGPERRWRTWAVTRRLRAEGTWTAVVTSADGRELGRTSFQLAK